MKREAEVNEMFASLREEKPEVSVKKVHKWLGISGGVVLSVYVLSWIKRVLFLKPVLMISSVIALGSLAFVTAFSSGSAVAENHTEKIVQQKKANQQKIEQPAQASTSKESVMPNLKKTQEESPLTLPFNPLNKFEQEREMSLSPLAPQPVVSKVADLKSVDDFDQVTVGSAFKVILKQGNTCSIDIQGTEEQKGNVTYTINDGHLKIKADCKGKKNCKLPEKIVLTMKNVRRLDVSGACQLDVEGTLKVSNEMSLYFAGAAQVEMKVEAPSIDCKVAGAVDLEMKGNTKKLELQTAGAANVDADDLKTEEVRVLASGATNTSVYGSKELKLIASGASNVSYSGEGKVVEKAVSGASSVSKD